MENWDTDSYFKIDWDLSLVSEKHSDYYKQIKFFFPFIHEISCMCTHVHTDKYAHINNCNFILA